MKNTQSAYKADINVILYLLKVVLSSGKSVFYIFLLMTILSSILLSTFPFLFPSQISNVDFAIYIATLILGLMFSKFANFLATYIDNNVYKYLSLNFLSHSLLKGKKLLNEDTAELLSINEQAAESASILVNSFFSQILPFFLQIILITAFTSLNINNTMASLLLISSILQCTISVIASSKLRKIQIKVISTGAEAYSNANESLSSLKTILSLRKQNVFIEIFSKKREKYAVEVYNYIKVRLIHDVLQVTVILSTLCLSFFATDYDLATLVTLNFILLFVLQGFDSIGKDIIAIVDSLTQFKASKVSVELMNQSIQVDQTVNTTATETPKAVELEIVSYENLGFQFVNPATFTSSNIVVLSGASGIGKTTLLEAIAGIRANPNWDMRVNQQAISALSDSELQGLFSIAYHDATIFMQNLAFNISLENQITNPTKLTELINYFELTHLTETDIFYDNMLSSGEKLRVGLARALYQDSPILLLDEPTANLDDHNREKVIALIQDLANTKLIICTSHDPDLLNIATQIIEFKQQEIKLIAVNE